MDLDTGRYTLVCMCTETWHGNNAQVLTFPVVAMQFIFNNRKHSFSHVANDCCWLVH